MLAASVLASVEAALMRSRTGCLREPNRTSVEVRYAVCPMKPQQMLYPTEGKKLPSAPQTCQKNQSLPKKQRLRSAPEAVAPEKTLPAFPVAVVKIADAHPAVNDAESPVH